jgi:hypothetical protein
LLGVGAGGGPAAAPAALAALEEAPGAEAAAAAGADEAGECDVVLTGDTSVGSAAGTVSWTTGLKEGRRGGNDSLGRGDRAEDQRDGEQLEREHGEDSTRARTSCDEGDQG